MLHVVTRVVPQADGKLQLAYRTGEVVEVDLNSLIRQGGVFAALEDPATFAQVTLGTGGRYIEWPGEVDLCADALWLTAHEQSGSEAA
ncbi:MAG: DUF2442 domain-containing protein [Chloroflexota bacterium]|nr:DUF2442 domain-containing protein [Chloroflexota bacterium]